MTAATEHAKPRGRKPTTSRRRKARIRHAAAAVGLLGVVTIALLPLLAQQSRLTQQLSLLFGYASVAALLIALSIGPLNVIRARPNPLSNDLRRDTGLASAAFAALHVVFALQHHFGGQLGRYFLQRRTSSALPIRHDQFGVAAWIGLVAVGAFVVLVCTSSDRAVRALGTRWKPVQRTAYGLAILTVLHTILFWQVLDRAWPVWALSLLAIGVAAALQASGFVRVRRGTARSGPR